MYCKHCNQEVSSGKSLNYGKEFYCTTCYNNKQYNEGDIDYFICDECGNADSKKNWIGNTLFSGKCFSCSFWLKKIENYNTGKLIVIDNSCYFPGPDEDDIHSKFKGFAGRKFKIQKFNGDYLESSNLWHNGEVPKRFHDRLPNNAKFVK